MNDEYRAGVIFALNFLIELYGKDQTDIENTDLYFDYIGYALDDRAN
jgi:hypothetical protein